MKKVKKLLSALLLLGFVPIMGCSKVIWSEPEPEVKYVGTPAPVPEGTYRYCWEEPMMTYEENGPGLDKKGHWYVKHHQAVRVVRGGKWRPCKQVSSESQVAVERNEQR